MLMPEKENDTKKKKIRRAFIFIPVCFITIVILAFLLRMPGKEDIEGISRYEWIQMLTETFELTEYKEETPYYADVAPDSPYFAGVQAACEWEIIEKEQNFNGETAADGKFVVLTAMKAMGKYRIKIYLGISEEPEDKEYLDLAVDEELVEKKQLSKGFSAEEASKLLERAKEFYLSGLWKKEVAVIEYKEGVMELSTDDILMENDSDTQLKVTGDAAEQLTEGMNVILEKPGSGEKIARRIVSIGPDGVIGLEDAALEEVLDTFLISDVVSISASDIISYYQNQEPLVSNRALEPAISVPKESPLLPMFDASSHSKGFTASLTIEDGEADLELQDKNTGIAVSIPILEEIDPECYVNAEIDIQRIDIGVQIDGMVNYANLQMETDIEYSSGVEINGEKAFQLFHIPIYLAGGTVCIDIPFFLVLKMDGSMSLQSGNSLQYAIDYTRGFGIRRHTSVDTAETMAAVDCEVGLMLRMEPLLKMLGQNVVDVEAECGVEARGEMIERTNSEVTACLDVKVAAPIVTVSVLGDDELDTILGDVFGVPSVSWEIRTAENAEFQKKLHYEWYLSKPMAYVDECTYQESGNDTGIDYLVRVYGAEFTSPFVDKGDYYSVTGKLYLTDYIPADTVNAMKPGDVYHFYDKEYTFLGKVTVDEVFPIGYQHSRPMLLDADLTQEENRFYQFSLAGDEENIYYTLAPPSEPGPLGDTPYGAYDYVYLIEGNIRGDDGGGIFQGVETLIDENYEFRILKNAGIYFTDEEGYQEYTAEKCYSEKIRNSMGNILTQNETTYFSVYFTPDGYIDHLSHEPEMSDTIAKLSRWAKIK